MSSGTCTALFHVCIRTYAHSVPTRILAISLAHFALVARSRRVGLRGCSEGVQAHDSKA